MSLNLDKTTWKRVTIGDVVKNLNVTVKDPEVIGIDRVIALEHLDPGELKISRWRSIDDGTTFTRRVKSGQTLFGKRRAYQRKAAYAEFDAITSGDILVFEADETQLLPEFLPFLVQSDGFYDHALGTSVGSLSPRTNWRDLANYEFDLPPLDVQKRLVDLLWAVEQHRVNTRRLVDIAARVEDAWLDSVYADLGISHVPIGSLIREGTFKLLTGPFGSALSAKEYTSDGVPVIHPSFIVDGHLTVDDKSYVSVDTADRLARWKVQEGDIVFMRKRDVTRSAIVTGDEAGWILGSDCISIRVDQGVFVPSYVRAMLRAPSARRELLRRAPGTAMPGINERSLSELLLPSVDISEQLGVLDRLETIAGMRGEVRRVLVALTSLRASLASATFEGVL